jgi:hydroxymethylbilane synthase
MASRLRIGSRPSALAIAQAHLVERSLRAIVPTLVIEIVPIRTSGDRLATASLADVGGKGLFVKELEQAIVARQIDIAIHSMKDLPARLADGLRIAAVPPREDPRDALVAHGAPGFEALRRGARIGTSSSRRRFEALRIRPDLDVLPMRGNVDTRLKKLESREFDAIIVAIAGLRRLGRTDQIDPVLLDEKHFVPAGGQGALAIEGPADSLIGGSDELERAIASLNDLIAAGETACERAYLATIGASCATAVGVRARLDGDRLSAHALLFNKEGKRALEDRIESKLSSISSEQASQTGAELGNRMLNHGASELVGQ